MSKILILVLLLLASCKSGEQVSTTGIDKIQFGNGGGFTGKEVVFTIKENGLIKNQNDSIVNKLNKEEVLSIFETASKNKNVEFVKPRNLYSFVTIFTPSGTNKIVWGKGFDDAPKEIIGLHKKLMNKAIQKN